MHLLLFEAEKLLFLKGIQIRSKPVIYFKLLRRNLFFPIKKSFSPPYCIFLSGTFSSSHVDFQYRWQANSSSSSPPTSFCWAVYTITITTT